MRSRRPAASHFSGLLSAILCCVLIASPAVSTLQGSSGSSASKAGGNHPTKGAPGGNLPNLDEVRRRGPARPKAQPPVPSRLKKCPPDEPNCNAPARAGNVSGGVAETAGAVAATTHAPLLGALAMAAADPYAGVLLASTSGSIPEPPRAQSAVVPGSPSSGWFSSLIGLFGLGAAAQQTPAGGFEGADCNSAWGYAWDPARPDSPVMVALYADGQFVASTLADRRRQDVATAGDGRHGFLFTLPDSLRNGSTHTLSVRVQGANYELPYSPKIMPACVVNYEGAVTSADCDQVTGRAWDTNRPSTPIDVDVYVDGVFAARASADTYNLQLDMGDNRHQFSVPTPLIARDGQSHTVTIRPAGSAQTLDSAATGACTGPSYQGYIDYADCDLIAGWAVDHNRLNTPVSVDIYAGTTFVTRVVADNFRQDVANNLQSNGRHGFVVPVPDSLRDGVSRQFTAVATGSTYNLNVLPGPVTCAPRPACSAGQDLASTEFVKAFYVGALARQPRPLELQYWNDALRTAAAQGQAALLARAKLLGRELFLEGEYANRGRMTAGQESNYVPDLYWAYLQRGPDASGQNSWVQSIQSQNAQGQNGWLGALGAFEGAGEFGARVASVCPSPADSVKGYDPARDFSPLQNPDGAWSYGYRASAGAAFTRYPAHGGSPFVDQGAWYEPAIADPYYTPQVHHGTGSQVVGLHPGPQGQQSVVRWTAPAAGTYLISGRFENQNNATTDVHVAHNSTAALFDGQVNGAGSTAPFSLTREVGAGETIDFSVGFGSNGNYSGDSTGLVVTVSLPPPAQTQPYNGAAAQAPGTIEAELFDAGGEGVAYHDTTQGSHGQDYDQPPSHPAPSFRQGTDVDIYKWAATYSNGHLVVMQAGDWMNYTVEVGQPGSYTLGARVAWGEVAGGTFHVEANGVDVTGPLQIPNTSWGLQTITKAGVQLPAGRHVLRVVADTNAANGYTGDLDYLSLTAESYPGLLARWAFDEGSGATAADSSGNGNTGSLQSGAGWGDGQTGSAATLDGANHYVQVGSQATLAVSGALTVAAWVFPTGGGTATVGGTIVNREGEYELARFADGTIRWAVANQSPGWGWVNTGYVAPLNRWTHITLSYDGTSAKTYADGQLVHTAAASGAIGDSLPAQNDFRVGGRQATPQNFQGRIDEVRVYGRALSAAEVGALVAGTPAGPAADDFSEAKMDPANQTGAGGDDPLSRNFNFAVPLLGLKGRAGLDLGLSLSYNSLVWTRDAATGRVKFDADDGDPSPGFRLGLPVIRKKFLNARGENAYMFITPSGGRVELRQAGTTNVYESADSSYTRLTEDNGLTLRPADGSQLLFALKGDLYKCTSIKDRNGNYITAAYDAANNVSSITDTLGRVVTFSYDANGRPLAVEQNRGGQVHQWATFGYANLTVGTQFADPSKVTGPAGGTAISVLNRVSLQDGSRYDFLYNSWGQVYRREYRAPDGRLLSYTEYDLAVPTSAQTNGWTDCPRFTQRRDFARDWNGDAPVVTSYSVDQNGVQVVKDNQTLVNGAGADMPATVMRKITYGAAGTFRRGLVASVETWGQDTPGQYALKRTAATTWTQDDESLPYRLNPRARVSEVTDPQGNHTGTTVDYTSFGLPTEVREWSVSYATPAQPVEVMQWNGVNAYVLRRTHTEYNLDPAYVSRRVLGLVSSTSVYDEAGHIASKVDYTYDQGGEFLRHQGEPVQHDGANYGSTFVLGRGLVTGVRRWDVTALHDITKSVEARAGYNTTGSLVLSRDPLGHQSSIAYAERFSDKAGTNTLAYPTLATDPDGHSSKVEYNFHTGLVSRKEDPKGAQQTFTYDAAGRTLRVEVSGPGATPGQVVSGGYTRWVYGDAMDAVQSWTQIEAGKPEVCSISVVDGAGRVRATASDFPSSQGGYRAQYTAYDIAGRASGRTNPTEVSGLWSPAGDDAAPGWKWTTQTYDWKSRPLVTTLPKVLKPSDPNYASEPLVTRRAEYGGCGCAGGEVATLTDEAGRRQKVYGDEFGRQRKTEVLNENGSVYSATTTRYNALNEAVRVRQYAGAAPSPEPVVEGAGYRTRTMTYDGHGRLKTRHVPEQDADKFDSFTYFADDTPESRTDARGMKAEFTYDGRHQLKKVAYRLPDGTPLDGLAVTFGYDAAGNRTSMSDPAGETTYHYDALSHMDWEERRFTGLTGAFRLSYEYNQTGALRKVKDRFGAAVTYGYDAAGQVRQVGTDGNAGTYVSEVGYRAWGAAGSITYGNDDLVTAGYDGRLRLKSYRVEGRPAQSAPSVAIQKDYSYYTDGRVLFADDHVDNRFDRAYAYDPAAGRLGEAYSGGEARDFAATGTVNPLSGGPYRVSYQYNEFGDLTRRDARYWRAWQSTPRELWDATGRNKAWHYDADGRLTRDTALSYTYDAAGRAWRVGALGGSRAAEQWADGDGLVSRRVEQEPAGVAVQTTYYLRSTVLGGEVAEELNASGGRARTYVRLGGRAVVEREGTSVQWLHADPVTGARVRSYGGGSFEVTAEPDAEGVNLGVEDPAGGGGVRPYSPELWMPSVNNATGPGAPQCTMDGMMLQDCELVHNLLASGAARQCPDNDCGLRTVWNPETGRRELSPVDWDPKTGQLGHWGWEQDGGWEVDGQETNQTWSHVFRRTNGMTPWFGGSATTPQKTQFVKPEDVVRCAEEYFGVKDGAFLYNDDLGFVQFLGTIETPGRWFGTNEEFVVVGPDYSKNGTQVQTYGGGISAGNPIMAAANWDNPRSYYFGNDVGGNPKWRYATHVHEIGNSLALLTGKFDYKPGSRSKKYNDLNIMPNEEQSARYGHDDPGVVFEDCVFGGQVRWDGSVNTPKQQ